MYEKGPREQLENHLTVRGPPFLSTTVSSNVWRSHMLPNLSSYVFRTGSTQNEYRRLAPPIVESY